jgi:hypothetical protein
MKKHLITVAAVTVVALLTIGLVVASPFPGFVDAVRHDYHAFVAGTGLDDVHKIGRDLERLQALEARK